MTRAALTCLLVLGSVAPAPALAQQDTTARIVGTVRSSVNGLPIAGVMVAVRGARVFGVSDSAGSFVLAGVHAGPQTVRILYRDSLSFDQDVRLKRGKTLTLSVLLDIDAVELTPIVVEARSLRAERTLAAFYDRKRWGFGRFYTLADLERRPSLSTRTLLGESGIMLSCRAWSCLPLALSGGRACALSVFLDGTRLPAEFLDDIRVDELAGVEVYKHSLDVPWEFRTGYGDGCGAIVMWSRR